MVYIIVMPFEANTKVINAFISKFAIVPIYDCLEVYAKEKARLRKAGMVIDEFDLLIGAAAARYDMVMVTNSVNHFNKWDNIKIENWTQPAR